MNGEMPSYTVMFQYLSDDRLVWIHEERSVVAANSADAMADVVREVQREHRGRKCIVKQIKKKSSPAASEARIEVGEVAVPVAGTLGKA
jgi:hypothetical protein